MAGPSIGTWVKVKSKSGRLTARVIANKHGGGNYEQGQVITQSEYEGYKKQRAEAIAGEGSGSKTKTPTQAAGGNVASQLWLDTADISVSGKVNQKRAEQISELYLAGEAPIRPILVSATGLDAYKAINRPDEAKGYELALKKNKFYEMTAAIVVNAKNEAVYKEQLSLTAKLGRDIPSTTAPPSQRFDFLKPTKHGRKLFDIKDVVDPTINLSASERKTVEALAQNYLKAGNVDPIIIKRKGVSKSGNDEYEVFSGRLEFAALRRANQLNPKFEMFSGIEVDSTNERNVVDQLRVLYGN